MTNYAMVDHEPETQGVFPIDENSNDLMERRRPLAYETKVSAEPMPKRRRSSAASDADNYVPSNSPANPSYLSSSAPSFMNKYAVVHMEIDSEVAKRETVRTPTNLPDVMTPSSSVGESPPESVRVSPKKDDEDEKENRCASEKFVNKGGMEELVSAKEPVPSGCVEGNVSAQARETIDKVAVEERERDDSKCSSLEKVDEEGEDASDDGEANDLKADPSDVVASPTPIDEMGRKNSVVMQDAPTQMGTFNFKQSGSGIPSMNYSTGGVPMPVANAQYQLQPLPLSRENRAGRTLPSFRDMLYCVPATGNKLAAPISSAPAADASADTAPKPSGFGNPMSSMVYGKPLGWLDNTSPRKTRPAEAPRQVNYPVRRVSMSRFFSFVDPAGHVYTVSNLRGFCQARGLNRAHMSSVFRGKRQHHKGWRRASVPGVPFPETSAADPSATKEEDDSDADDEGMGESSRAQARCGPRGSGPRNQAGKSTKEEPVQQPQRRASEPAAMDLCTPRTEDRRLSGVSVASSLGADGVRPTGTNLLELMAKCAEESGAKPTFAAENTRPRSFSMVHVPRRDSLVSSAKEANHRQRTDSLPGARLRKDSVASEGARMRSKLFAFIDPYGNKYQVDNLSKLCEMFDLTPSTMSKVHRGVRLQHKGWQRVETEEQLGICMPCPTSTVQNRLSPKGSNSSPGNTGSASAVPKVAGTTQTTAVRSPPASSLPAASPTQNNSSGSKANGPQPAAPSFAPTMPLDSESETDSDVSTTSFHFVDADGHSESPVDLLAFCHVRNLSFTMMKKVSKGTVESHKGWKKKGSSTQEGNVSSMGSVDEELDHIHGEDNEAENGQKKSPSPSPQSFAFIDPFGARHECNKLSSFCRTHGLTQSSMSKVHRGVRYQHKGWRKADGGLKPRQRRRSSGPASMSAGDAKDEYCSETDTDSEMRDEGTERDKVYQKVFKAFSFVDSTGKSHSVSDLLAFCGEQKLSCAAMSKLHRGIVQEYKGWHSASALSPRRGSSKKPLVFVSPLGELVEVYNLEKFCGANKLEKPLLKALVRGTSSDYEGWKYADDSDSSDDDDLPLNEVLKKSAEKSAGDGKGASSDKRRSRGRPSNLARRLAAARQPSSAAQKKTEAQSVDALNGLHFLAFASEQIETQTRTQ